MYVHMAISMYLSVYEHWPHVILYNYKMNIFISGHQCGPSPPCHPMARLAGCFVAGKAMVNIWGSSTWSAGIWPKNQKMGKQASHNGDLANKSTNNGRRWGWVKLHLVGPIFGMILVESCTISPTPRTGRRDNCGVFIRTYEGCNQQWGNYPKGIGWLW